MTPDDPVLNVGKSHIKNDAPSHNLGKSQGQPDVPEGHIDPRPSFVDRRPKPRRDWRTIPLPDHTGRMLTPEEWAERRDQQR